VAVTVIAPEMKTAVRCGYFQGGGVPQVFQLVVSALG
jgi:hypothetical protein